jgi:hypothetical protein
VSKRKPHNEDAGYVASRRHPVHRGWVVIYEAAEQDIDVDGNRYAVVCSEHATICGTDSLRDARVLMKSAEFCEERMRISAGRE